MAEEKERLGQQAARYRGEGPSPAPPCPPQPSPALQNWPLLTCRQRAELDELRQQLEESSSAGGRALRAEFEKGREEQERRHQVSPAPSCPGPAPPGQPSSKAPTPPAERGHHQELRPLPGWQTLGVLR